MARLVRPVPRSHRLIACALLLFLAQPHSGAQGPTYDQIVDRYAEGDTAGAVMVLSTWAPAVVKSAANDRPRTMSAQRQRAAVMLHTEVAYALVQRSAIADASAHITSARRILSVMKAGLSDARAQAFERRWYAFVASLFTAYTRFDDAELTVRDGLGLYPRDARLHVARGVIREMSVTLFNPDPGSSIQLSRYARVLESASADFRRAIGYDDTLSAAYLHLGWVHFVSGDDRAGADLESALARADDNDTRYVAQLFLGAFEEHHERLDAARLHYEAALGVGPNYQTAFVALSRLEEALGHHSRAQELARAYASLRNRQEDPWWNYRLGGFDQSSLDWLRHEARTP